VAYGGTAHDSDVDEIKVAVANFLSNLQVRPDVP
jgi:hypothetical protein